jgi:N utilization substance protein A
MASGLADAIRALVSEKGISEDLVIQTIEEFLLAAYKKTYGTADNAVVKFDDENGEVAIYAQKEIVEDVYNPVSEIELDEAKQLNSEAEIGDELLIEIDPTEFDRVAVQSAKQKARQTLREIQKDTLYSEFKGKEGEMIIGYYQRERNGTIFVDLGKTEGLMPKRYQSPREVYRPNDRIKAMIHEVNKTPSGLQIILTRTHTEFVRKIFELEVPEIYDKTVEIFKIVREPGYRTKIAVYSNRLDVDPVGACVGLKGVRIQAVVRELEGEKIDILKFETDPRDLIKNALSPAQVRQVLVLDEGRKHALAIVDEDQLSLAIGKQGLNVRLANRLVDWNIDVKTEAQFEEMDITVANKQGFDDLFSDGGEIEITRISELPDISPRLVAILNRDNIEYIEDLIDLAEEEMVQLDGITEDDVQVLQRIIRENLEIIEEEGEEGAEGEAPESDQDEQPPLDDDTKEQYYGAEEEEEYEEEEEISLISELPGIPGHIVETLKAKGVLEIVDLLNMEDADLESIPGLNEDDVLTIKNIIAETVEIIEEDDEDDDE